MTKKSIDVDESLNPFVPRKKLCFEVRRGICATEGKVFERERKEEGGGEEGEGALYT